MSAVGRRKANAAYVHKDPALWQDAGWTSVPNSILRDPDVPPDEVWAWAWLCSHSGDFEVSGRKLYEAKTALGRNRAYELLSALERRGLLRRYHTFDEHTGVPYLQYDLQPVPLPEEERTWEPPRAKPRERGPHPGSKAVRTATEPAGQQGFPTGREPVGESRAELVFPDGAGETGPSRQGGSRQGGKPYMEEKIMEKINQPPVIGDADGPQRGDDGWLDEPPTQQPAQPSQGVRFLTHLPASCRPDLRAINRLAPKVDLLLAGEWTEERLRQRLTGAIDSVHNPAGVLISRLMDLPLSKGTPAPPRPVWCGDPECDERTRQRENAEGFPYRCPRCHPKAVSA